MSSTAALLPHEKMKNRAVVLLAILLGVFIVFSAVLPSAKGEAEQQQQQQGQQQLSEDQTHQHQPRTQEYSVDGGVEIGVEGDSNGMQRGSIKVSGAEVSFLGNLDNLPSNAVSGARNVLLLHGAKYNAETWKSLGTLQILADGGHRVAAIDLPTTLSYPPRDELLEEICIGLGMTEDNPAVIISPSMSGSFSVPLLMRKSTLFKGFVPVAPPKALSFSEEDYGAIENVPALIVYGEKDRMGQKVSELLSSIPGSHVLMIEGGSHPAYMDDPLLFHTKLLTFLQESAFP